MKKQFSIGSATQVLYALYMSIDAVPWRHSGRTMAPAIGSMADSEVSCTSPYISHHQLPWGTVSQDLNQASIITETEPIFIICEWLGRLVRLGRLGRGLCSK